MLKAAGEGVLGDVVDIALRRLDGLAGLSVIHGAGGEDLLSGDDELALDRLVVDDLTIVGDIGHIGQSIDHG